MRVVELRTYPVKSCGGLSVDAVTVDRLGLSGDRRWCLVDAQGRAVSQKRHPGIVHARVIREAAGLVLVFEDVRVLLEPAAGDVRRIHHYEATFSCVERRHAGLERALAERLGVSAVLVELESPHRRKHHEENDEWAIPFTDAAPVSIVSRASLEAIAAASGSASTAAQFRVNVVVDGFEAFAEDTVLAMTIGSVRFRALGPITRCRMIEIDQISGAPIPAVLRNLTALRPHGRPELGTYVAPVSEGQLAIGMAVHIG